MTSIQKDGTIVGTPSSISREGSANNVLRSSAKNFLGGARDDVLSIYYYILLVFK